MYNAKKVECQMNTRQPQRCLLIFIVTLFIWGCEPTPKLVAKKGDVQEIKLQSFEDDAILGAEPSHAVIARIQNPKFVTDGDSALQVTFNASSNYHPAITFKPTELWDWRSEKPVSIAMDISNPTSLATHVFAVVVDHTGISHNRSVIIPSLSSDSYFIELSGSDLSIETGLRSNPADSRIKGVPFIWRWGEKKLDLSDIKSVKFGVYSLLDDRQLVMDNLRLVEGIEYDLANLENVVDQYGQNTAATFPEKVISDQQLIEFKQAEEASFSQGLMADRSEFGGWKDGPKLQGTGNFRTEKVAGKWALVDPQGYLFFSTGIANVRMSNTSTITGIDFDQNFIKQREKGDLTPEDSLGLNPVSMQAQNTRYVASQLRHNMFTALPDYSDPLANHYGYRRTVHTGALERGETYSFYRANLERKYGEPTPESFLQDWQETTLKRMKNWGFTSFGNWLDPVFYSQQQVPYFANGWIIGNYKTITSGNDYWSPLPDPFDPVFRERTVVTVEAIAAEVNNSPWCIGVFIDNEKSWGREGSLESQYGIAINGLKMDAASSPTKAHFTQILRDKYQQIESLNRVWGTNFDSWETLSSGIDISQQLDRVQSDLATLLFAYAEQYFAVVNSELKRVMPDHLYMGARFADWGMTPEVVKAAAKHADVVSYNYYKEGLQEAQWAFLAEIDMPSIIGEFHMGATDTGLFNPGLVHSENQHDRARLYSNYMQSVINNPYFVGAHWFQYTDSPLTGRAYDGENYNVGFVSVTDTPYKALVDAAKKMNKGLYPKRFGSISPQTTEK